MFLPRVLSVSKLKIRLHLLRGRFATPSKPLRPLNGPFWSAFGVFDFGSFSAQFSGRYATRPPYRAKNWVMRGILASGTLGAARTGLSRGCEALPPRKSTLGFMDAQYNPNPKSTLDYRKRKAKLSTTLSKLKPLVVLRKKSSKLTRISRSVKRSKSPRKSAAEDKLKFNSSLKDPEDNPRASSTSLEKMPKKTTSSLSMSFKAPKSSGPGLLYAQANHDGHISNREKAPEYSRRGNPPNLWSKETVDPLMIFRLQDKEE